MVEEAEANSSMSALAILSCRQNSHPFQERHIALLEPTKIGRSVARARPAPNNGIFDCKVLSRNHAMMWYENGIFYLQDTKSSNGTFVNDQRLCKGGEESPPREIYSGDLIQFGVNVMENNRRGEKITHGCIVATITLFHPDGREAKPVLFNTPTPGITIQSQELYKLAQYLQEALHREKMLEQKLSTLQKLVQNTQESSEGGWQALIDEDRLLSRLEVLENQLHAYSKNHTEDTLRQELVQLQEEKLNYETTAKESLMKVLQEKIEAVGKLSDLERSLTKSEDECGHMKEMCEQSQEELQILAEKYQDQLKAVQDLQIQLQDAETKHMEEIEKAEKDKLELQDKLEEMIKQEATLTAKVESLQVDQDISNEQLTEMKARLDQYIDTNEDDHINNMKALDSDSEKIDSESEVISSVIIQPTIEKIDKESIDDIPEDVEGKLKETQQQIEVYKLKLEESEKQLQESAERVEQLQRELETSKLESLQYVAKIASLEDKIKLSDLHMNQMVENTMADLTSQMTESTKQSSNSNDLIKNLQDQVVELEKELSIYKVIPEKMDTTLVSSSLDSVDSATLRPKLSSIDDSELESLLRDARTLLAKTEEDLGKCKEELNESQNETKQVKTENSALKTELSYSQKVVTEKSEMVIDLQDQLQKAENTTKEVKQQILVLRDQLVEEQTLSKHNQEQIESLKGDIVREKTKHEETLKHLENTKSSLEDERISHEETKKNLTETKKTLTESQQASKQSQNEAAQLRTNEFVALKEECSSLRKRIQAIEADMRMSRKENLQLSSEYNKLQESYKELEALKDRLQDKESTWMSNLTDSQKENESSKQEVRLGDSDSLFYRQQLMEAKEEIQKLKKRCEDCDHEISRLKGELKRMSGDYGRIAGRSKLISFVSCIPLLMLLFAVLLALYPTLERLTAIQT
ncbi:hypothetical protein ACF0H5_014397 [Mactra antiquata]